MTLSDLYDDMAVQGPFRPDAGDAGQRALRLSALGYLSRVDDVVVVGWVLIGIRILLEILEKQS